MFKKRKENIKRQAPLIYKILQQYILRYTTLLTVQYSQNNVDVLKREVDKSPSCIIRKRCRALLAKMSAPSLSCQAVSDLVGCCRNLVRDVIHSYNKEGIDSVLTVLPKTCRPSKIKGQMGHIDKALETGYPGHPQKRFP